MVIRSAKKTVLAAACPDIELGEELGAGGNARVYAGISKTHGTVAVKFMLNDDTTRYGRFRDEVLVVTTTLAGSKHVVPILEHQVPCSPPPIGQFAWYVMPTARRLSDSVAGMSWADKLQMLAELADGLVAIHALKVAHRDIKPDNLLELDGTYRYGDFGIASFPDKSGLTRLNQPMGPWAFMAPEMLSDATIADPFKADVYSFAKTVWCLLTGKKIPFIGSYHADSSDGLVSYSNSKDFKVEPLDSLLTACTAVSPADRPDAPGLATALRTVISVQSDYEEANKLQWKAAEAAALLTSGLVRAVWEGALGIAEMLTLLGRRHGMNHCFLPEGGGNTLSAAFSCEGGEMLALRYEGFGLSVVKPIRLTLERIPGHSEFSYAVLETADTDRLGEGDDVPSSQTEECLWRLNEWDYAADDSNRDEPRNAGKGEYCQRRFKGGTFIIAPTTGAFNRLDDYAGTEGKAAKVRDTFVGMAQWLKKRKLSVEGAVIAREVRLLVDASVSEHHLKLKHIDDELLTDLVHLDDALTEQRDQAGRNLPLSIDSLHFRRNTARKQTPLEEIASNRLKRLTQSQRAELKTLIRLGRNAIYLGDVEASTTAYLEEVLTDEDAYLIERLGNGNLRKALARFGLVTRGTSIYSRNNHSTPPDSPLYSARS